MVLKCNSCAVWLTSATTTSGGVPVHFTTELSYRPDDTVHVFPRVLTHRGGWICITVIGPKSTLNGTAVFRVIPGAPGASLCTASLVRPSSSASMEVTDDEVRLEMPGMFIVTQYTPEPETGPPEQMRAISRDLIFAEQSWVTPVSVTGGWPSINRAVTCKCGIAALSRRFNAFADSAAYLLRGHHLEDMDTWLATTLQRAATQYIFEQTDDRGPAELCFGRDEDCDGQAASVCLFANSLIAQSKNLVQDTRDKTMLMEHLTTHYSAAVFVLGQARDPRKSADEETFYHAYAALVAKVPGPSVAPLNGALIIECTAPINPKSGGAHPGVMDNQTINAMAIETRKIIQFRCAPQVIVGVRERLPWFYGEVLHVVGPTWAVSYPPGTTLASAVIGATGTVHPRLPLTTNQKIRAALHHHVTGEQVPWTVDGMYCIREPPPGRWTIAAQFDNPGDHNCGPMAWGTYVALDRHLAP